MVKIAEVDEWLARVLPRRPYDEDEPTGYLESDRDYALNNLELVVEILDTLVEMANE